MGTFWITRRLVTSGKPGTLPNYHETSYKIPKSKKSFVIANNGLLYVKTPFSKNVFFLRIFQFNLG